MSKKQTPSVQYDRATPFQMFSAACCTVITNSNYFFFMIYFSLYCTNSLGLNALLVGTMMTVARFVDGITDPIFGLLMDRTNTRFGRFRPFCLVGTVIMNASLIILFWGAKFSSQWLHYVWLGVWYIIWVIGYTLCTTSTQAAMNVATNDPKQRTMISALINVLIIPMQLLIANFGMRILLSFGGTETPVAYRKFTWIIAAISLVGTALWCIGIASRDNPEYLSKKAVTQERYRYRDYFTLIGHNRPLASLIVAASTNKLASTAVSNISPYLFLVVVGSAAAQATITTPATFVGVLSIFIGVALAYRMGKKRCFELFSWVGVIVSALIIIIRPFSMTPAMTVVFIVLYALSAMANSITSQNVYAMIPDCTDYENWKHGRYVPGMVQTSFTFVDKIVSSLSGLIMGAVLTIFNYTAGEPVTTGLYWGILLIYAGMPLLGHLASVIALKFYPITPESFAEMTAELNARSANKEAGAE